MASRNGRKKPDAEPDSTATAVLEAPASTNGTAEGHSGSTNGHHETNGQASGEAKRRPTATFAAMTDRTTRVEVAVWANVHQGRDGEYTQYSLTFRRSWRDNDGNWHDGGSYRVHDTPVLLYLIDQAYAFCVGKRTEVKIADDGTIPF